MFVLCSRYWVARRYFKIILHLRKVNFCFLLLPETHPYYVHGRWRFFLTHLQNTSYDFSPFSQRNTTTVFRQHVLYFSSIRQGCSYQNFNWSKSLSLFARCLLYMNLLLGLYVRFREKTFHHLKCTFCLHCFLWAPVHEDVPHRRYPVRCHLVLSLKALGVGKKVFSLETLRSVDTLWVWLFCQTFYGLKLSSASSL